ncbi:transcriptional regulator [Loa loa]|uniref:protein acetyllysine N-acetyltransferase n=1 Tax=Loa loa TaxID=7209 RepID=A0A1I7VIJ5_LOALO|nr:transcriptional regulator [Loa loa]EFO20231.2 transcriptional regulator [Loa loa]
MVKLLDMRRYGDCRLYTGTMKRAERLREVEEADDVVAEKCKILAGLLKKSKCTVVYTGAGISTAASIPDYRGPNGVWTLAEKGIVSLKCANPVESGPTASHMILKEMCRSGLVRHILSQNCDGLHLRSGLPQKMLSEIHGNMHIEVCQHCEPPRQYIRPFDVTEKSQFRRHGTGRMCLVCNNELADTIVHFGEAGKVPWPLNWNGIISLIDRCDLILCIGTSLAVLKEYHFLWPKPRCGTQIAIINLQWTPKDRLSCLKINAKCDIVMEKLAGLLGIPINRYCRNCDPVLNPKRSVRVWELRERLTDCTCRNRMSRATVEQQPSKGIPGWWAFEIQKAIKRSSQVSRGSSGKRHCSSNFHRSGSSDVGCNSASGSSGNTKSVVNNTLLSAKEQSRETVNGNELLPNTSRTSPEISTSESFSDLSENSPETSSTDGNVVDPAVAECLYGILLSLKKEPNSLSVASKVQKAVPNTIFVCT